MLHRALAATAERFPDRTAVSCSGSALTYAELERRSDQIGALLQKLGVRRGDLVGVCLPKSTDAIAIWFGALKAGAAYVPLDHASPAPRLRRIIEQGRLRFLVASARRRDLIDTAPAALTAVVWDASAADAEGTPAPTAGVDLDTAYVYFTSGSTGQPKGVAISHRASLAYLEAGDGILSCGPDDVIANHAPLAFDLASFDVHLAARTGARLSLIPEETTLMPGSLLGYFAEEKPTLLYAVPTALHRLAALRSIGSVVVPSLRGLLFAGETPQVGALTALRPVFPNATFHHWYGSTEAALVTAAAFPPGVPLPDPMPMGRAVPGVELALVDDELLVSAVLLFDGYCHDPAATEAAFRVDTGSAGRPVRWFRTRDLVRRDSNGELYYVGRKDRMVKIKGLRVDLGEIEAALVRAGAPECAVVSRPDPIFGARVYAFVAGAAPDAGAMLDELRRELPAHMVPERISVLPDGLPRTSSGKLDRLALADGV